MRQFSRKKFVIFLSLGVFAIPLVGYVYQFIKKRMQHSPILGEIKSASYKVGHLLWNMPFKKINRSHDINIIGSGISGLSAGKELLKNGESDFVLLELEPNAGGNARYGENAAGRYPLGAHYLPLPALEMKELIDFLKEIHVIESFSEKGLPIYDERYLCAAPEDRLYIHGHWQSGIVPNFGLAEEDKNQIRRFQAEMKKLKQEKGADGLYVFSLPLKDSSQDAVYTKLDTISMKEYLREEGYTSEYLFWYVNYCCKDDYGTSIEGTSAWAGLHYFCSRRGVAANAEEHDQLTWPEGNGWLMDKLKQPIYSNIRVGNLAYEVNKKADRYEVLSLNTTTGKVEQWNCDKIIFACPQFVIGHIRTNIPELKNRDYDAFHYSSWMVGNLLVKNNLNEKGGVPLCWDNVIYNSSSLGYVNSNAQYLQRYQPEINLTYYYAFDDNKMSRKKLLQASHEELTHIMLEDLKNVYIDLEESIIRYDPFVWGHAMIKPQQGFIWGEEKKIALTPINNAIYFAHTDLSGISVFEEAFYQGITAARAVLHKTNGSN
jgi:protoporphyrinogen oxidase